MRDIHPFHHQETARHKIFDETVETVETIDTGDKPASQPGTNRHKERKLRIMIGH